MKREFLTSVILLTIFISCTALYRDEPRPFVHIRVEFDSTFLSGSMSEVDYWYEDEQIEGPESYYDTEKDSMLVKWDSTCMGHYSIELRSIFLLSDQQEFDVYSDTTLYVVNRFPIKVVDTLTLDELYAADTVECVYIESGCFHFNMTRTTLIRTSNGYSMFTKDDNGIMTADRQEINNLSAHLHIDDMHKTMTAAERYVADSMYISTSSSRFYLRADGKVYRWRGYDSLY